MQSRQFPVGTQVSIEGPQARIAEVIETRPGHCKCALPDGRAVWIPVNRLSLAADVVATAQDPASEGFAARGISLPKTSAEASAPAKKSAFPLAWVVAAAVVTSSNLVVDRFLPGIALMPGSAITASLVIFGLLAIWKSKRTWHTAARVFVVVGGVGLANAAINLSDATRGTSGNTPELNAQIQERLQAVAANAGENDTPSTMEARRLEALEWAASVSSGPDARLFSALVELQKTNVELASELGEATAALDATSAPPGLARVDSRKGLGVQANLMKRHSEAVGAWLAHLEQAPAQFEKLLRDRGISDEVTEQQLALMDKSLPARVAHYERAAQIDALHAQLYTLLDQGWGTWKYDASEQRVSFDSGPVGKYNALLRQIQQVAGVDPEASDEPSRPANAPEARSPVDTHNPGFKADRDAYERRMREEQEKKWGKASGLESLQHLRNPR